MGLFDAIDSFLGLSGKDDALEQNQNAIDAQKEMAGASNQTIRDMYSTGRQDQMPFITPSLSALPMYQSAILGGPVEYSDPRYQRITSFDPDYAAAMSSVYGDRPAQSGSVFANLRNPSAQGTRPTLQLYRAPDGSYTDKPPQMTAQFNLQEDPGFQWRNKQLDRSLRSLGRNNSTYGMQAKADFAGNEYDRGVNRLATLAGFGSGTNSNVAASGNNAAGQIARVNTNAANSLGNLYTARGGLYTDYSPLAIGLGVASAGAAYGGTPR